MSETSREEFAARVEKVQGLMATRMKEAGFEWKAVAAVFTPEQLKCQVKYTDDLIRKVETVVFGQPVSG